MKKHRRIRFEVTPPRYPKGIEIIFDNMGGYISDAAENTKNAERLLEIFLRQTKGLQYMPEAKRLSGYIPLLKEITKEFKEAQATAWKHAHVAHEMWKEYVAYVQYHMRPTGRYWKP